MSRNLNNPRHPLPGGPSNMEFSFDNHSHKEGMFNNNSYDSEHNKAIWSKVILKRPKSQDVSKSLYCGRYQDYSSSHSSGVIDREDEANIPSDNDHSLFDLIA